MLSVPFLSFPPGIQLEIVKSMDLRELVKFSSCSRQTFQIAKSAQVEIEEMDAAFFENCLDVEFDDYSVCINPMYRQRNPIEDVEFTGFCGLQMYEFPTSHSDGSVEWNCIVLVPEGKTFLETSDTVLGYLTSLFHGFEFAKWRVAPVEPVMRGLQKYFPKFDEICVFNGTIRQEEDRLMTKEEAKFMLEEFEVTRYLWVIARIEEGFQYSKGFNQDRVNLDYPSWMHWDAIINSSCRCIRLHHVRAVSSADLNRLLKLWVSNEKLQGLGSLTLYMDYYECLSFPEGLMELVLEGIDHEDLDMERWAPRGYYHEELPFTRQIRRVDGKLAAVKVRDREFRLGVF